MGYQGRDVEIVSINPEQYLVVACDSCGAIGLKELDQVKVAPTIVGRLTMRGALLEIITTGSQPQLATIAISNELDPTGTEILTGVHHELAAFDLDSLPLAISSEKNMHTQQTGLGVSVVGLCAKTALRIATTRPGDIVYCLGIPKMGSEVHSPDDPQIVQSHHLQKLLLQNAIHDIVPVGSQGIRSEAVCLASSIAGRLILNPSPGIDLAKSAGPSTCLIFSTAVPFADTFLDSIPCHQIGKITLSI